MSRGSLVSTPESWPGEGEGMGGDIGIATGEMGEGRRSILLGENTSGNFVDLRSPPARVSRSVISSESLRSRVSIQHGIIPSHIPQ